MKAEPGPIQAAHRRIGRVTGEMSLAIVRQDAPPARVAAWVADLRKAASELEARFLAGDM